MFDDSANTFIFFFWKEIESKQSEPTSSHKFEFSTMGFRILKRRIRSETAATVNKASVYKVNASTTSRRRRRNRTNTDNESSPIVAKQSADDDSLVSVRGTSICNSGNLDQRHQHMLIMREADDVINDPSDSTGRNDGNKTDADPWSECNLQATIARWKLNEAEIARLKELQHNLKDCAHHYKYDPEIVLRFMTSPLGKDAENMFRKMVQWRIENNIDTVLDDYKPDPILTDYNVTAILKDYDYDGDPIYVERGGASDGHGMLKRFTREQLMDFAIYTRELNTQGAWIKEYHERQGRTVKDVTVVYDLKGMNSHHLNPNVLNMFGAIMTLNSEKYPGPLKRMIIIRAPAIFRLVWAVAKNFFPQSSRDKMVFAGKHPEKILAKYMDIKVLPPCICEGGEGQVATGLPPSIEGGFIPDHVQPLPQNQLLHANSSHTHHTDHRQACQSPGNMSSKTYRTQDTFEHDSIVSSADTSIGSSSR